MYRSVKGLSGLAQLGVLFAFLGFGFILAGAAQLVIALQIMPKGSSISDVNALMSAMLDPKNVTYTRIGQVLGTFFLFFIPAYLYSLVANGKKMFWLGFNKYFTASQIVIAFFIILAASFATSALVPVSKSIIAHYPGFDAWAKQLEKAYNDQVLVLSNLKSWPEYITALAIMAFFPAMFEEIFFRGVLQRFFEKWWKNPWLAIVVVAVIFSIFHSSVYLFATRLLLGVVLGYVYYATRNIWINIVAHFLNNAIALTQMFAISKQNKPVDVESLDPQVHWIWSVLAAIVLIYLCYLIYKISKPKRLLIESQETLLMQSRINYHDPFQNNN